MGRDLPLGRIAGIRVGMNWTVLLIAGLYTTILANNRFPNEQPGLSNTAYWAAGIAGALLFFLSLLAHEVGHALVARHEGIGVRGISLWLLGGVARLESSPTTPGAELRIAAVGPATSAACGVVFLMLRHVLAGQGGAGLASHMFGWLGLINLLLAVFNMIPASPLDGGRVLSALLWMRWGSAPRATVAAARVGQALGAVMLGLGFIEMQRGGDYGLWLLVVGGYILFSSQRELRSAPLIAALDGVRVRDGMLPGPPVAAGAMTVDAFLRTLSPATVHQAYPVLGPDGRVNGMLTADSIRAVAPERWAALRVSELAFPLDRITMVSPDEPLLNACQKLEGAMSDEALVVDAEGQVMGTMGTDAVHFALERRRTGV
ncbi:MAG: site-2 protease family protein [Acidimicrobiales bacterium]|nr:site-2 protease family protein [Acidimicrobiales bacterium]